MTFPRTVCQHTTHGADRTLTFEDGIEAAAKVCEERREMFQSEAKWAHSSGLYEAEQMAKDAAHAVHTVLLAIRALSHKEPSK